MPKILAQPGCVLDAWIPFQDPPLMFQFSTYNKQFIIQSLNLQGPPLKFQF